LFFPLGLAANIFIFSSYQDEGARFSIMSYFRNTPEFAQHLQRVRWRSCVTCTRVHLPIPPQVLFDMRFVIEGKSFADEKMSGDEWGRLS
jgi:hypothetical protein